jgi:hypothetical protein
VVSKFIGIGVIGVSEAANIHFERAFVKGEMIYFLFFLYLVVEKNIFAKNFKKL